MNPRVKRALPQARPGERNPRVSLRARSRAQGLLGNPDRDAPTGLRRWLAMPLPLVLWLLLSPVAFVLMTKGPGPTSREVHPTVRTDLRNDTRTTLP